MKPTKEEILKSKFKNSFLDLDYLELYIEAMQEYAELYHKERLRGVFDKVLSFYIEDGNPECFRDKIINLRDEYLKTKE